MRSAAIELAQDEQGARLTVRDDGDGFERGAKEGSFGMLQMRERAQEVGARIEIDSAPGLGTRVVVVLPRRS